MKNYAKILTLIGTLLPGALMAGTFLDYDELAAPPAPGDAFVILDVSDTTMSAEGTTKYMLGSQLISLLSWNSDGTTLSPIGSETEIDFSGSISNIISLSDGLVIGGSNVSPFGIAGIWGDAGTEDFSISNLGSCYIDDIDYIGLESDTGLGIALSGATGALISMSPNSFQINGVNGRVRFTDALTKFETAGVPMEINGQGQNITIAAGGTANVVVTGSVLDVDTSSTSITSSGNVELTSTSGTVDLLGPSSSRLYVSSLGAIGLQPAVGQAVGVVGADLLTTLGSLSSGTPDTESAVVVDKALNSVGGISFEGAVNDTNETVFSVVEPTADQTYQLPDKATGTYTLATTADLHDAVTIGTANGLSLSLLSTQEISLAAASTGTTGALTSTDWNTFNGKQAGDAGLTSISGLTTAANNMIYTTALDTYVTFTTTAFGRSLLAETNAASTRTTLEVDAAGTDNSTDVTLAGAPDYITISGQVITRNQIDLEADVTGVLQDANVSSDLTIGTGSEISGSTITLAGSASPGPTAEGVITWDTDDDQIAIGDGTGATQ